LEATAERHARRLTSPSWPRLGGAFFWSRARVQAEFDGRAVAGWLKFKNPEGSSGQT